MEYHQGLLFNIWNLLVDFYGNKTKMADALCVDRTYMWYRTTNRYKKPPKPDTLLRIVNNSNNILDYLEMMWVCGYLPDEYFEYPINENIVLQHIKDRIKTKGMSKHRALVVLKKFVTSGNLDDLDFEKTELLPAVKKILEDYK